MNTAVLFLIFNRPDTTERVFDSIRASRPPRLYIASDGPRKERLGEDQKVYDARKISEKVDWPCEVFTLFRDENLGCKVAISTAISWFFENEERGIILEDDCLPHPDFFRFCETLLDVYAEDERIWAITGNNFQDGQRHGDAAYYFSRYFHCWGWATWRRAWVQYDMNISFWPEWSKSSEWKSRVPDDVERNYWGRIFNKVYEGSVNSWAYPYTACVWRFSGLVATPNVNLVSNIGFSSDATHTIAVDSSLADMAVQPIGVLVHPVSVERNISSEKYTFDHHYGGIGFRFPYSWLRWPFRVLRHIGRRIRNAI
ncbi:hypothetical protein SAMN03159475_2267 [Pseudomonas sp. NFPP33]|nr:glycosyltransferase family A protein [Pseudomonas sp. NFPP33]SDA59994.1 hypothetical protein SAMN03159475_2267 [Pseudomonas sp. NFPP33]